MPVRTHLRLASLIAAIGASIVAGLLILREDDEPAVPFHRMVAASVTTDDLAAVDRVRVFFHHASVGMNVLDAIPGVYADLGLPAPRMELVEASDTHVAPAVQQAPAGGFLAHTYFGQNGDPMAKIRDFDARVRDGVGDQVDVAFMKFCYADVISGTDVDAVFEQYRSTMAALERDYPDVTFLHVTTPLSTDPGWKSKVKKLIGKDSHMGPADNLARQRLNDLMRSEYPADRLFDLAAIESTAPDGARSDGTTSGQTYYSLYEGYAADAGHLNEAGASVAAAHLLHLIADTARAERR